MGFFDKVKAQANGVVESQKYSTQISKVNKRIEECERTIKAFTDAVGRQCVEQHLKETDTEYESLFSQIRAKYTEIEKCKQEIEILKVKQNETNDEVKRNFSEMKSSLPSISNLVSKIETTDSPNSENASSITTAQVSFSASVGLSDGDISVDKTDNGATSIKYCPSCGNKNDITAVFCTECGSRFPDVE